VIIQIRGTSGSGKTHTAYELRRRLGDRYDLRSLAGKHEGYLLNHNVALVGKYTTACGGCDTIKTQAEVERRVRQFHQSEMHVVFEGLLISQIYGRYYDLSRDIIAKGGQYVFAYLDTPIEKCIAQVLTRRDERAAQRIKGRPAVAFNETNTRAKHADCLRNREKDIKNGVPFIDLKHDQDPAGQIIELLGIKET
jgi:cytidylate kinase